MLDYQVDAVAQKESSPETVQQKPKRPKPKLLGFSEQLQRVEDKKAQQVGPDSWAVRKFAVGLVIGIYGYSYYVFVVRLCIRMVRLEGDRRGGRALGLAYLVVYHFLFILFVWSYAKAITTSPGFARDYVPKSDPPPEEAELVQVEGYKFEHLPRGTSTPREGSSAHGLARQRTVTRELMEDDEEGEDVRAAEERRAREEIGVEDDFVESHPSVGAFGPAIASLAASTPPPHPSPPDDARSATQSTSGTTAVSSPDIFPVTYPPKSQVKSSSSPVVQRTSRDSEAPSYLNFPQPPHDYEPPKPRTLVDRIPPRVAVLTEDYRYDSREGLLRPYRSHRCKHCAAVVLKMDHHCPWVGACVGARNYKYFYNFLQYSTFYTFFVFITLLVANVSPPYIDFGVDGQQIAILVIAGLFALFTGSLLVAHTRLMLLNITTIEDIGLNRIKSRERSALTRVHGFWGWRAQRRTKKEWDRQWGRLGREGNLWWLGSKRANWEMVMGQAKLGWFLPIRAQPISDDGLSYKPNPRFSKEGFWQERKDWPVDLR